MRHLTLFRRIDSFDRYEVIMLKFSSFDTLTFPSTFQRAESLWIAFKQGQVKALNELKCLHRDPESSEIHFDHPSSTGFYHMPGFFP